MLISNTDAFNLFSVSSAGRNPYFNMVEENEEGFYGLCKKGNFLSRQSAPKVFGNKHDVIGIRVYDKMDMQLPDAGLLQLQDAETNKTTWIDSSDEMVRYNYQQHFMQQSELSKNYFRRRRRRR